MLKKIGFVVAATALLAALAVTPAVASDHLFNAVHAPGATNRGFANPVANNPSGTSGAMAMPATVPGEGDPKVGADLGTPSVNLDMVVVRSGGHGSPQR